MARLHRPYIPISVRVQVAARQLRECKPNLAPSILYGLDDPSLSDGRRLDVLLHALFTLLTGGMMKFELHHRPALVNRRRYVRNGKVFYEPPANDPAHLVYLAEDDHDVETRVRGVGALRSDLGQARYNKRVAKNRAKRTTLKVTAVRTGKLRVGDKITYPDGHEGRVHFVPKPKRKWASRPLRGKSTFERRT